VLRVWHSKWFSHNFKCNKQFYRSLVRVVATTADLAVCTDILFLMILSVCRLLVIVCADELANVKRRLDDCVVQANAQPKGSQGHVSNVNDAQINQVCMFIYFLPDNGPIF